MEKRREEIGDMYQNMMEESEARLHKANESNAGLAEQHFSSRKRDFQRRPPAGVGTVGQAKAHRH